MVEGDCLKYFYFLKKRMRYLGKFRKSVRNVLAVGQVNVLLTAAGENANQGAAGCLGMKMLQRSSCRICVSLGSLSGLEIVGIWRYFYGRVFQ